jgi:DNA-binding NarL/FixJ family response regulator
MLAGSSIKIVAETDEVTSALALSKKHSPDVVLLDAFSTAGRGYKVVGKIRKIHPDTKFLFLAARENPTYLARAKAVGASNVLMESIGTKELVAAIENAVAGKPAKPSEPFAKISEAFIGKPNAMTKQVKLTPRELQILAHVAFGLINDEIAASLGIGDATVKEHVRYVLRKLKVVDRTQAALWAVQNGVV